MFQKFQPSAQQESNLTDLGNLLTVARKKKLQVSATVLSKTPGKNFILLKDAKGEMFNLRASSKLSKGESTENLHLFKLEGETDDEGNDIYIAARQGNMVETEWI